MDLRQQKYLINFFIASINSILISTFLVYEKEWYAYLFILIASSALNASSSILNLLYKMYTSISNKYISNKYISNKYISYRTLPKNYMYVIPCYNESEEELRNSLHSLIEQRVVLDDKRSILIICDGKVKGVGNSLSTDVILKKILHISELGLCHEYVTWNNTTNTIYKYICKYAYNNNTIDIILLIKAENYGKRDSLVIARRMCYLYNTNSVDTNSIVETSNVEDDFLMQNDLSDIYNSKPIDYIIGIDADTIFDYNCTYELIQGIEQDKNIHGCVGLIDINPKMRKFSFYVLYQYAEYIYAQCLRRHAQSNITHKVSCLSGCNQILRISEETCGEKILKVFNYYPKKEDFILTHIRSYASEDRNHVCNMLSMYPYVKTTQNLKAISYTIVPTSIPVFLSQRRRWNLGATTNDMLLIYFSGINIFERILAFVNVSTFTLSPFIFVATIRFIISIITDPTWLMLYLSIILFIPVLYSLVIPIFIKPMSFNTSMYYYFSYLIFISCSGIVNLISFINAIMQMDLITWGKTRSIVNQPEDNNGSIASDRDNKRDKDIKDGYIELEYDYNYLEISMKDNLYGTLDDYTTNENILIENNTRNHKVFYAEV